MVNKFQINKWNLHSYKKRLLSMYGLKNGLIIPYDDQLIENSKVRKANNKNSIISFITDDDEFHQKDFESDKYALP